MLEERTIPYPKSMKGHPNRDCSNPEWEFQYDYQERCHWLCLGCNVELLTDFRGKEIKPKDAAY